MSYNQIDREYSVRAEAIQTTHRRIQNYVLRGIAAVIVVNGGIAIYSVLNNKPQSAINATMASLAILGAMQTGIRKNRDVEQSRLERLEEERGSI